MTLRNYNIDDIRQVLDKMGYATFIFGLVVGILITYGVMS